VAEAFVQFLLSRPAQEIFAQHGLRSVDPEVAQATADKYPPVEDLFTIEYFGGWDAATPAIFGDDGVFHQGAGGSAEPVPAGRSRFPLWPVS
jgi:sulfate/thiosulfate transport system substrate-binding protein